MLSLASTISSLTQPPFQDQIPSLPMKPKTFLHMRDPREPLFFSLVQLQNSSVSSNEVPETYSVLSFCLVNCSLGYFLGIKRAERAKIHYKSHVLMKHYQQFYGAKGRRLVFLCQFPG